jgi:hypothetical protein
MAVRVSGAAITAVQKILRLPPQITERDVDGGIIPSYAWPSDRWSPSCNMVRDDMLPIRQFLIGVLFGTKVELSVVRSSMMMIRYCILLLSRRLDYLFIHVPCRP